MDDQGGPKFELSDDGAIASIWPEPGHADALYSLLRGAHPNMTVYRKRELPQRLHYAHNRRIPPIVAIPDEGWQIVRRRSRWSSLLGNHGCVSGGQGGGVCSHCRFYFGRCCINLESRRSLATCGK